MEPMDALLQSFVEQFRMKLPGSEHIPCYEIVGQSSNQWEGGCNISLTCCSYTGCSST